MHGVDASKACWEMEGSTQVMMTGAGARLTDSHSAAAVVLLAIVHSHSRLARLEEVVACSLRSPLDCLYSHSEEASDY